MVRSPSCIDDNVETHLKPVLSLVLYSYPISSPRLDANKIKLLDSTANSKKKRLMHTPSQQHCPIDMFERQGG